MNALKWVGVVLLVLSVPLLLGAIVFLGSDSTAIPNFVQDDRSLSGYVSGGVGGLFLLVGILLMVMGPRKPRLARGKVSAHAQPQHVEIKRTEMNWGAQPAASPADVLQENLEEVNRKMGQLKVQYGMGQLSSESYKVMMAQYEQEKVAIERDIIQQSQ